MLPSLATTPGLYFPVRTQRAVPGTSVTPVGIKKGLKILASGALQIKNWSGSLALQSTFSKPTQ